MKNKRSIYTIAIIFACAILSSCSDWLDVNHNPNSAEKVDPGYGLVVVPEEMLTFLFLKVSSVRQTAAMIMGTGRKVIMS